jgi:hypothetical protein
VLALSLFVGLGIVGSTAVFIAFFPVTVERLGFKVFSAWLRTWWDEDAKLLGPVGLERAGDHDEVPGPPRFPPPGPRGLLARGLRDGGCYHARVTRGLEGVRVRLGRELALLGVCLAVGACGNCGGSSGGSSGSARRLVADGGSGRSGNGGKAGTITINGLGASLDLGRSGDLSGVLPSLPALSDYTQDLGDNPLTVTRDRELTSGDPIVGDDGVNAPTGITVAKGATLTLGCSFEWLQINLVHDLVVNGTLAVARVPDSLSSCSLEVHAANVWIGGRILSQGGDAERGADGGDGGSVSMVVQAHYFLSGAIIATGGAGDRGGRGGGIAVGTVGPPYAGSATPGIIAVTGLQDSSGGEGRSGVGGDAGSSLPAANASGLGSCNVLLAGTIRADGGKGTAGGGAGGLVNAFACTVGWVVSTGAVESMGGDATAEGPGGAAGQVLFGSTGGILYVGGSLRTRGGAAAGAGTGGDGGLIDLTAENSQGVNRPLGVHLAADVDLSGGGGAAGGRAGRVDILDFGSDGGVGVFLYGYQKISAAGGAGTSGGGAGGALYVYNASRVDSGGAVTEGNTVNHVDVSLAGGAASAGAGGAGGLFSFAGMNLIPSVTDGSIDLRGGSGATDGGAGGKLALSAGVSLASSGTVQASGGAAGTGRGGAGGELTVTVGGSSGTISVAGPFTASGGGSLDGAGGAGGAITCQAGTTTTVSALLTADGGSAVSTGGGGGAVSLASGATPTALGAAVSVRGGAGGTVGLVGQLTVDGTAMSLINGQYHP